MLSGINRGANAGYAILHSGTVGATLTAANQGMRGLAVSLDVLPPAGADPATGGASLADMLDGDRQRGPALGDRGPAGRQAAAPGL